MTVSTCKACGRPIRWVRTTAGRLMPLDPEPVEGGNVELVAGKALVHGQPTLDGTERYVAHFATCPNWPT